MPKHAQATTPSRDRLRRLAYDAARRRAKGKARDDSPPSREITPPPPEPTPITPDDALTITAEFAAAIEHAVNTRVSALEKTILGSLDAFVSTTREQFKRHDTTLEEVSKAVLNEGLWKITCDSFATMYRETEVGTIAAERDEALATAQCFIDRVAIIEAEANQDLEDYVAKLKGEADYFARQHRNAIRQIEEQDRVLEQRERHINTLRHERDEARAAWETNHRIIERMRDQAANPGSLSTFVALARTRVPWPPTSATRNTSLRDRLHPLPPRQPPPT